MQSHSEHHPHAHHTATGGAARALIISLLLTLGFAGVELTAGWMFGSLALMSDSGHMFSDAAALLIAVIAARVALKPPGSRHSYGFARAEVIAATLNGLLLLAIVVTIVIEAIQRLQHPQPVAGGGVIVVALIGLVVNVVVLRVLGHDQHSLNTRAARLHVLGDLLGSIAALTAGIVIAVFDWYPIDPLLSFLISGLILLSTIRMLRDTVHVLMEGVPLGIDLTEAGQALARVTGVRSVHDLHIWTISSGQIALSAHVDVDALDNWPATLERIRGVARSRFGIEHVTIQPEVIGGINAEREVVIPIIAEEGGEKP